MLAKNTIQVLQVIANKGNAGITKQELRLKFPEMTTTMMPRFKDTNLITGTLPENGAKSLELFVITSEGAEVPAW